MRGQPFASLIAAAACIGLAGTSAVKAAPSKELDDYVPTGSHIRLKPTVLDDQKRNMAISAFSRCLVIQAAPKVDHYLRNSDALTSKENASKFLPLADCLGEALSDADQSKARFSLQGLRGWLAEQAYLRTNKKFVAVAADAPPSAPRQYLSINANLRVAKRVGEFSDCIVARDASGADAILRTTRGSTAEFEAAKRYAPTLSACVGGGSEVSFNSETLRAYVADGLWQRYEAGKPTTFKGAS